MVYRWARRIPGNAQECGEELERLKEQSNGELMTKDVVNAARPADNPLHRCFEWRDDVASERWREHQARQVISSIRVVTTNEHSGQEELVQCYVSLQGEADEPRAYVSVAKVVENEELFERARQQFIKELQAFKLRYQRFTSLRRLVEQMQREASDLYAPVEVVNVVEATDQSGTVGAV